MGSNYNYYYYHSSIPYEPKVGRVTRAALAAAVAGPYVQRWPYFSNRVRIDSDTVRRQGALLRTQAIDHVRSKIEEYNKTFLTPDKSR